LLPRSRSKDSLGLHGLFRLAHLAQRVLSSGQKSRIDYDRWCSTVSLTNLKLRLVPEFGLLGLGACPGLCVPLTRLGLTRALLR